MYGHLPGNEVSTSAIDNNIVSLFLTSEKPHREVARTIKGVTFFKFVAVVVVVGY
jgi:hypothetical protein